mmetsp:Transcript_22140/g.38031  ORF Transcript_22140/g.38031 Transcript_22140/m.38031 type:complete len:490 (+) Transcript_22140:259-1728(+)
MKFAHDLPSAVRLVALVSAALFLGNTLFFICQGQLAADRMSSDFHNDRLRCPAGVACVLDSWDNANATDSTNEEKTSSNREAHNLRLSVNKEEDDVEASVDSQSRDASQDASSQDQCTVNKHGLMELNRPLRVFVFGPIREMVRHAEQPHSYNCDEGMFGMQVRVPDYFSKVYKHRVSHPDEADLIIMAVYAKCYSQVIVNEMRSNRGQMNALLHNWTIGNFSQQFPGALERRNMRDIVFMFPSGNGAYVVPGWQKMLPNAIFLNTEASNWKQRSYQKPYHAPEKDIVIPGYYGGLEKALQNKLKVNEKKTLAMYCGNFETSKQRQDLGLMSQKYNGSETVLIKKWCDVAKYIDESKFCIVPQGWTPWTVRAYESMIHGCLPILFGTLFQLPYEHYLPYSDFMIRWPEEKVDSSLVKHLESIPEDKLQRMHQALLKERFKVTWDWNVHPNSFEMLEHYLEDKFCTYTLRKSSLSAESDEADDQDKRRSS